MKRSATHVVRFGSISVFGSAVALAQCLPIACSSTSETVLEARADAAVESGPIDAGLDAMPDVSADVADASDASRCAPDASFDSDPLNCGRCGHDCQRGACVQGVCQAVLLGTCFAPYGLAVD